MDEQEQNTYVLDAESPVEMARLIDLHRVVTGAMGGPLTGVPLLPANATVLDLACGPGGWVLDMAFNYPEMEVAGVDISRIMVEYACARARTQKLPNASFGVMDITKALDFSDATFDLVNARFLVAVLKREAWKPFLAECTRILKPGGLLRLTEPVQLAGETSSAAYEEIIARMTYALFRAGYGFSVNGKGLGMSMTLPHTLRKMNYVDVRSLAHSLDFSEDTGPAWMDLKQQIEAGSALAPPFMERVGAGTRQETEPLYPRAVMEMHQKGFVGAWHFVTVLGQKP